MHNSASYDLTSKHLKKKKLIQKILLFNESMGLIQNNSRKKHLSRVFSARIHMEANGAKKYLNQKHFTNGNVLFGAQTSLLECFKSFKES